jgi:release factor glutamine methyltransferase
VDPAKPLDRETITALLAAAGCIAPAEEADELISSAAGDQDVLAAIVGRRTDGEPLAWLTGSMTFADVTLIVEPGVYVPRMQTEALARRAASLLPPTGVAVDLCTGAGAIAAVMAAARPRARVVATELEPTAARCARRNDVEVFEGSLDDPLPAALKQMVDVMTAVVPYVPTDALRLLPRDVQAFEPRLALDGGTDGTDLLAEVVRRAPRWLRQGGSLLLELGGDQAQPVGRSFEEHGFADIDVMADEDGDTRAIAGRLA